jgi:YaiO family outer membrane protein
MLAVAPATTVPAAENEYRRPDAPKNSFTLNHEYEDFRDDSTKSWQLSYIEYSHKFENFGSVILRMNRADRFGQDGYQYEIDAYPRLGNGFYMFLNAGWSDDSLFPDRRFGAQIYKNFEGGWEASIGARYLDFGDSTTIYTGSIGRYVGNWYTTLSPYVVHDEDGTSATGVLEVRRYLSTGDDYWLFRGSYGNAPDVDTLLLITNRLDNWSIGAGRQLRIAKSKTKFLKLQAGYREREYNVNVRRESIYVEASLKFRF